jgi:hypothetical protein
MRLLLEKIKGRERKRGKISAEASQKFSKFEDPGMLE